MRYLKIFEEFDLGFKGYNNSSEIGDKFLATNIENLVESEINQITEFLDGYEVFYTNDEKRNNIGVWIPYKDMKGNTMQQRKYIKIERFKDEWFLVTDYPSFYECDQVNGVINFLKTIIGEPISPLKVSRYTPSLESYVGKKEVDNRDRYWDKYLKKLNTEINKPKENHDDYYKLIDNSDWDEYEIKLEELLQMALEFTEDESTDIRKVVPKVYSLTFIERPRNKQCIEIIRSEKKRGSCLIRIWKLPDEWFLVSLGDIDERGTIYFKCDQFEGLQYFLNKTLLK